MCTYEIASDFSPINYSLPNKQYSKISHAITLTHSCSTVLSRSRDSSPVQSVPLPDKKNKTELLFVIVWHAICFVATKNYAILIDYKMLSNGDSQAVSLHLASNSQARESGLFEQQ